MLRLQLLWLLGLVDGHAVLLQPLPRGHNASKLHTESYHLAPFSSARREANRGCGGIANGGLTVQIPTQAFRAGSSMTVRWRVTAPHNADVLDRGIRISIFYGMDDAFECNVTLVPAVITPMPSHMPPWLLC